MFRKNEKTQEKDLVLIESQTLQEKCGKCEQQLIMKTYWSKNGYKQKIVCETCDYHLWKTKKPK